MAKSSLHTHAAVTRLPGVSYVLLLLMTASRSMS